MYRCRAGRSDRVLGGHRHARSRRGEPVMARRLNASDASFEVDFRGLLFAKREEEDDVALVVRGIIADVRKRGDEALVELTNKLDRAGVSKETLKLTEGEID